MGVGSLLGLDRLLLEFLNGFLDVLDSFLGVGLLKNFLENLDGLLSTNFVDHDFDGMFGLLGCLEAVMSGDLDSSGVMSSHGSSVVDLLDMSDLSNDSNMSSHHLVEGTDDVAVVGEAVSSHNMEQFVDHSVGMGGGMSDDAVELIDKPVVLHDGVHLVLIHFHITF